MQSITHTSFSRLSHKPKPMVILLVKLRTGSFSPYLQASSLNPPLEQIHCPVSPLLDLQLGFAHNLLLARHRPVQPNTSSSILCLDTIKLSSLSYNIQISATLVEHAQSLCTLYAKEIATQAPTHKRFGRSYI